MPESYETILRKLRAPTRPKAREAMGEVERCTEEAEQQAFRKQAASLNVSYALDLCHALSGATQRPFLELLAAYANRSEGVLRERSLKAFEEITTTNRIPVLCSLLKSAYPETRAEACKMLAYASSNEPIPYLTDCLSDQYEPVILEALAALRRLQARESVEQLEALCKHPSPEVRRTTIEVLTDVAAEADYPAEFISSMLRDTSEIVREGACWSLGRRPSPQGSKGLLACLQNDEAQSVRIAAAAALQQYQTPEVAGVLLRVCAASPEPDITLQCRRALNAMPESTLGPICDTLLTDDDPMVRLEVALLLGDLTIEEQDHFTLRHLNHETDESVRAALLESVGRTGNSAAWPAVRECLTESQLVSYAAIRSLANLLDDEHLMDFAQILTDFDNDVMREAVLKQLALYGQANPLPAVMAAHLRPLLKSKTTNIAMLSAEAAAFLDDDEILTDLIFVLRTDPPEPVANAVRESCLQHTDQSMLTLLTRCGPEYLDQVNSILCTEGMIGQKPSDFLALLAQYVTEDYSFAKEALQAACRIAPQAIEGALLRANEPCSLAIVKSWGELSAADKKKSPLPFAALLTASLDSLRYAAMSVMDQDDINLNLHLITDIAFNPEEPPAPLKLAQELLQISVQPRPAVTTTAGETDA